MQEENGPGSIECCSVHDREEFDRFNTHVRGLALNGLRTFVPHNEVRVTLRIRNFVVFFVQAN